MKSKNLNTFNKNYKNIKKSFKKVDNKVIQTQIPPSIKTNKENIYKQLNKNQIIFKNFINNYKHLMITIIL
jgi:hypothetical protein